MLTTDDTVTFEYEGIQETVSIDKETCAPNLEYIAGQLEETTDISTEVEKVDEQQLTLLPDVPRKTTSCDDASAATETHEIDRIESHHHD